MTEEGSLLQDAIDRDIDNGTLVPITDAAQHRIDAQKSGTYDIYVEIDVDCEELVDACGLDYIRSADDDTQNEVCLSLDAEEWSDFKDRVNWSPLDTNEQLIGAALLNDELSEYVTKATIYKPSGDIISFY